jgi:hypothetical protein
MSKVKKAIFEDEEALQSIEELKNDTEEIKEPSEEEIEKLFSYEPLQVEEVPRVDTTIEVVPLRDFKTNYGGVQYYFSKGKRQRVPVEVKDFLLTNKQNPKIKDIW